MAWGCLRILGSVSAAREVAGEGWPARGLASESKIWFPGAPIQGAAGPPEPDSTSGSMPGPMLEVGMPSAGTRRAPRAAPAADAASIPGEAMNSILDQIDTNPGDHPRVIGTVSAAAFDTEAYSMEHLTGLHSLLAVEVVAYVDLAVRGPLHHEFLRPPRLPGFTVHVGGAVKPVALHGLPSIGTWSESRRGAASVVVPASSQTLGGAAFLLLISGRVGFPGGVDAAVGKPAGCAVDAFDVAHGAKFNLAEDLVFEQLLARADRASHALAAAAAGHPCARLAPGPIGARNLLEVAQLARLGGARSIDFAGQAGAEAQRQGKGAAFPSGLSCAANPGRGRARGGGGGRAFDEVRGGLAHVHSLAHDGSRRFLGEELAKLASRGCVAKTVVDAERLGISARKTRRTMLSRGADATEGRLALLTDLVGGEGAELFALDFAGDAYLLIGGAVVAWHATPLSHHGESILILRLVTPKRSKQPRFGMEPGAMAASLRAGGWRRAWREVDVEPEIIALQGPHPTLSGESLIQAAWARLPPAAREGALRGLPGWLLEQDLAADGGVPARAGRSPGMDAAGAGPRRAAPRPPPKAPRAAQVEGTGRAREPCAAPAACVREEDINLACENFDCVTLVGTTQRLRDISYPVWLGVDIVLTAHAILVSAIIPIVLIAIFAIFGLKPSSSCRSIYAVTHLHSKDYQSWNRHIHLAIGMPPFAVAAPSWGLKRGAEPAQGAEGPDRKKHIQDLLAKGEDVSTVKKLLTVLTKLSLTNAAEIREITGMLWNTVLVEVKSPIAVEMMARGKSYHEESKKAKGDPAAQDRLGPPYVHIFAGLMLGLSKTEPQLEETHTNSLTEFWAQQVAAEGKTPLDLLGKVMYCKCKAAKVKDGKPGLAKVTIAMSTEFGAVQVAILAALAANGGIKKHGPAPRGPLERAAQELLEVLEGTQSKKS
ncbi:unnamed protein product [Prorocentrum cordatum]|uniref:Uncharacterized protein n=1 Tax=Prorocentrum cordatum TaxID=2364126 RepID=A0ABN9RSD0_9DINO|nr:unnamed protein product [Polarella glacialis]